MSLIHFLIYSPLEQFEINSYNSFITYFTTFPIEIFEYNFFSQTSTVKYYSIIEVLIFF